MAAGVVEKLTTTLSTLVRDLEKQNVTVDFIANQEMSAAVFEQQQLKRIKKLRARLAIAMEIAELAIAPPPNANDILIDLQQRLREQGGETETDA